jgi:hypothetical protein
LKINDLDKKAIDNFLNIDNSILEKEILLSWKKDYGLSGTSEQAKTFVSNSKTMLSTINLNQEISSKEIMTMLSVALFKYAKKLEENLAKIPFSDLIEIRIVRDEKLTAEKRAVVILASL